MATTTKLPVGLESKWVLEFSNAWLTVYAQDSETLTFNIDKALRFDTASRAKIYAQPIENLYGLVPREHFFEVKEKIYERLPEGRG